METQVATGFYSFEIIKQTFWQLFKKIIRIEMRFVEYDGDLLTWLCSVTQTWVYLYFVEDEPAGAVEFDIIRAYIYMVVSKTMSKNYIFTADARLVEYKVTQRCKSA